MAKRKRLSTNANVRMSRSPAAKRFLEAYMRLGDRLVDRLFIGKASAEETRYIRGLLKKSPDDESLVSSYLARKKV